jgi:hypothetical protein
VSAKVAWSYGLTTLAWNYAARVLLFPARAALAFLAGLVATVAEPLGITAAAIPPELASEVVRTSR